jgi:hypothetical protein
VAPDAAGLGRLDRWGGRRHARRRGRVDVPRRGLGRPARHLAARRGDQGPGRHRRRARLRGGPGCSSERRGGPAQGLPTTRAHACWAAPPRCATPRGRPGPAGAGDGPEVARLLDRYPLRELVTRSDARPLGTFATAASGSRPSRRWGSTSSTCRRSTRSATDVPQGPQQHPRPRPRRPRLPWAIGSAEGGHDASTPTSARSPTSTLSSPAAASWAGGRARLRAAVLARPPVGHRAPGVVHDQEPDGTIAYAENPPKKYQDIYPLNFDNDPRASTPRCCASCGSGWPRRADLPGRQPAHQAGRAFWEWLLAEVAHRPRRDLPGRGVHPAGDDAQLGKVGFHQSYTYFTWRNGKLGAQEYLTELSDRDRGYMRPNFFVNTPDILHAYLQYGGPPRSRSARARRDAVAVSGASTPATSCSSTSPCGRAARSTSTLPADARRARPAPDRRGPARELWDVLGAHVRTYEASPGPVHGTSFAVWAPNARGVASSATSTTGTATPTRCARSARPASGSCSSPASASAPGTSSRSSARTASGAEGRPDGRAPRCPPATASVVTVGPSTSGRTPSGWPRARARAHAGRCRSTRCTSARGGNPGLVYRELADELVDYVATSASRTSS